MRIRADLTLLLVTIIWGSAYAVMRFAAGYGVVFYLNGARFLVGAMVLLPFVRWRGAITRANWYYLVLAGITLFGGVAFQQSGLRTTSAGNAGFFTSLYVILVPFILWLGWRERLSWLMGLAAGMAVAGGYLLSTAGQFRLHPGDALVFVGSFFWAAHVVVVGKVQGKMNLMPFSCGQLAICGLLSLLVGAFFEYPSADIMIKLLPAIIYTGVFSLGLAFTLQVTAQKHTPANDAALIMSLEAVFAVVFGWIFLHEALLLAQILGCILILMAVVLVQLHSYHLNGIRNRRESEMVK